MRDLFELVRVAIALPLWFGLWRILKMLPVTGDLLRKIGHGPSTEEAVLIFVCLAGTFVLAFGISKAVMQKLGWLRSDSDDH